MAGSPYREGYLDPYDRGFRERRARRPVSEEEYRYYEPREMYGRPYGVPRSPGEWRHPPRGRGRGVPMETWRGPPWRPMRGPPHRNRREERYQPHPEDHFMYPPRQWNREDYYGGFRGYAPNGGKPNQAFIDGNGRARNGDTNQSPGKRQARRRGRGRRRNRSGVDMSKQGPGQGQGQRAKQPASRQSPGQGQGQGQSHGKRRPKKGRKGKKEESVVDVNDYLLSELEVKVLQTKGAREERKGSYEAKAREREAMEAQEDTKKVPVSVPDEYKNLSFWKTELDMELQDLSDDD